MCCFEFSKNVQKGYGEEQCNDPKNAQEKDCCVVSLTVVDSVTCHENVREGAQKNSHESQGGEAGYHNRGFRGDN